MKVLMVCLGNICRSPLAEGVLTYRAKEEGLKIHIDSAGTSAYHIDEAPDTRMIQKAAEYQIDISNLRARQFEFEDFDIFDIIYVMDKSNFDNVLNLAESEDDKNKVKLLLNEIHPGNNKEVPDPYFGGDLGFETVFQMVDKACEVIISNIKNGK